MGPVLRQAVQAAELDHKKARSKDRAFVPGAGIEPAWTKVRWILSPVRLPISPPRRRILKSHNIHNRADLVKNKKQEIY